MPPALSPVDTNILHCLSGPPCLLRPPCPMLHTSAPHLLDAPATSARKSKLCAALLPLHLTQRVCICGVSGATHAVPMFLCCVAVSASSLFPGTTPRGIFADIPCSHSSAVPLPLQTTNNAAGERAAVDTVPRGRVVLRDQAATGQSVQGACLISFLPLLTKDPAPAAAA